LTSYTLASIADWVDPAIGAKPTVNDPPKVVGGITQ